MFRLKLVNKPKMIKLKCNFKFPNIILANLQKKEATPTKEEQTIKPDKSYDGLSEVLVKQIPEKYIIPQGEINITENGDFDVSMKQLARVNVPEPTGTIQITSNGTYNVKEKEFADVNVPEPKLGTKSITSNGTYKASDDGLDGYSEVSIETSGVDINDYFDTTITDKNRYYFGRNNMIKAMPPFKVEIESLAYSFSDTGISIAPTLIGEEKVTNFYYFLQGTNVKEIPQYNTKNGTNFQYAFYTNKLEKMPLLNFESANNIYNIVSLSYSTLIDVGGFQDLGKNYSTKLSENSANTKLNLSAHKKLTQESLMNIINNLYDIASAGVKPQQLVLGSENLAKLTAEEVAIGTSKGWSIS